MNNFPSREVVLQKIKALRTGSEPREVIAEWAAAIVADDAVEIVDGDVWKALKRLGGADLPGSDRAYLYEDEDFSEWESTLLKT
jgi:hypothetical protein